MLKEGYTLPFQSRPNLTRSPKIINCYVHPHRNLYWLESLHQLMDKGASSKSLRFFNRLFGGCTQSAMGESGHIRLPTSSHIGEIGGEVAGLPMQQNHSDCSGVAQHALVLGSSGHVQPNPTESVQSAYPVDTALQSDPSQKSDISKSPCMAPRASAIKEQGFSEAVAARIEAPQRGSTRSVYGPFLQIRWTSGHPL